MAERKPIECKPGQGVLFAREKNGNRPVWVGACNVDGVDLEIAGWVRTSAKGTEYISLSIKKPQKAAAEDRWQP